MSNVNELKEFIKTRRCGQRLQIATSGYAYNTTKDGFRFDFISTAPAVRSLIKQGWLKGDCRWRYYDVKVLPRKHFLKDPRIETAYDTAQKARCKLMDLAAHPDATDRDAEALNNLADDIRDACDRFDHF